jgi:hypothetical protein
MQPDFKILLPGDTIPIHNPDNNDNDDTPMSEGKILLGPGTMQSPIFQDEEPIATKSGVLKNVGPRWWIESSQRRVGRRSFYS